MRHRFKADPKWITIRYPARCAYANCRPKSIPASERSTTLAISPCTALVAVIGKKQTATSTPTGSTRTDSKPNSGKEF